MEHGSPYDRGWEDAAWGHIPKPHKIVDDEEVGAENMTPAEIKEYWRGFDECETVGVYAVRYD